MKPPEDEFTLHYSWSEGSIPPPYHYEYDILFDSTGSGSVMMIPDYPGQDVPRWNEPFAVTPEVTRDLRALLVAEGLFTRQWLAQRRPPVGGSHAWLSATTGEQTVEVPAFVEAPQQEHTAKIYAAIRALVPQAVGDQLEAQREQYVQEHSR